MEVIIGGLGEAGLIADGWCRLGGALELVFEKACHAEATDQ